jgi:hypothetical protein
MAEDPSHVQRVSLSHLFEIGLRCTQDKELLHPYACQEALTMLWSCTLAMESHSCYVVALLPSALCYVIAHLQWTYSKHLLWSFRTFAWMFSHSIGFHICQGFAHLPWSVCKLAWSWPHLIKLVRHGIANLPCVASLLMDLPSWYGLTHLHALELLYVPPWYLLPNWQGV